MQEEDIFLFHSDSIISANGIQILSVSYALLFINIFFSSLNTPPVSVPSPVAFSMIAICPPCINSVCMLRYAVELMLPPSMSADGKRQAMSVCLEHGAEQCGADKLVLKAQMNLRKTVVHFSQQGGLDEMCCAVRVLPLHPSSGQISATGIRINGEWS